MLNLIIDAWQLEVINIYKFVQLDAREYNCFKEISESCLTNSIFHLSSPRHFPLMMKIIREFY